MEEYAAGTVVVITDDDPGIFYSKGTKAKLVEQTESGVWWADFRGQGNAEGTFDDSVDGVWCIGKPGTEFERA